MTIHELVLQMILCEPGTLEHTLGIRFDLTQYRLRRVLRHINEELSDQVLIRHERNGCWIVDIDGEKCLGMEWRDTNRGYYQCDMDPQFPDQRCYVHSNWQSSNMTAFERKLYAELGPCDPTSHHLARLSMVVLEELSCDLKMISPKTLKEHLQREQYLKMVTGAMKFLQWKERAARMRDQDRWIPPEFADRHRRSSGNSFEFTIKKYFAVLEVSPDTDREGVLKAWRKLARRYHPDVQNGDEERMKAVNLAKERIFRIRRWD